jgi:large subunit ribosomal protein L35
MPKMKTNRAAAKRFKRTGTGLISYKPEGHRHGLSNKSRKHNRNLRRSRTMSPGDQKLVDRLVPYI